jgi:hypothetical protein
LRQAFHASVIFFSVTYFRRLSYCLLIFLLLLSNNVQANDLSSWNIWKKNSELSVFYRASQYDDVMEIKAQAQVNSSLAGFIYFIKDFKQAPH